MPEHAARGQSVLPDDGLLDGAPGRRTPRGGAGEDGALGALDTGSSLRTFPSGQLEMSARRISFDAETAQDRVSVVSRHRFDQFFLS